MITEKFIVLSNGHKIYCLLAMPVRTSARNKTVILLHSLLLTSDTWKEIGTMDCLAAEGHTVVAIDLPGYGKSPIFQMDVVEFMNEIFAALNATSPVLVSPSVSGVYSIPFLYAQHDKLSGFVPIAPATSIRLVNLGEIKNLPTLIIYGSKDKFGKRTSFLLFNIHNSTLAKIPRAGVVPYLNNVKLFHSLMLEFLVSF